MRARLHRALRELGRSERGIALPVTMLITVIGMGLAAIPIMASVNSQTSDSRDQASDSALSAADSGASIAVARQTKMASFLSSSTPCVKVNGTTLEAVAAESGWCPAVGPVSVGRATYSYRVKPVYSSSGATMTVFATGTAAAGSRSTSRRLAVTATSSSAGRTVFGSEGVIGIDSIIMDGSASIYGDAGTNGYIDITPGNPSIPGCSKVRVGSPSGEFKKLGWQSYPACPIVQENREYPPPIVPATNSNGRMFTAGGDTYTYSGGALAGCGSSSSSWCPTTKVLSLNSDAAVTLGGSVPYVFCQLILAGNSRLIMAAGAHVQIIFDSPENCKQSSGVVQMRVDNGAKILSSSYSPTTGNYSVPGFYFVGSATLATKFVIANGASGSNVIVYGPRTAIEVLNGASFGGAILGKTVFLSGGTRVKPEGTGSFKPDENLPIEGTGGSASFARSTYVECSATPTVETEPASGC